MTEIDLVQIPPIQPKKLFEVTARQTETFEKRFIEPVDYGTECAESYEPSVRVRRFIVEEVLSSLPYTTNNDALLYLECLRAEFKDIAITSSKTDVLIHIPKSLIKHLPTPETFTRIRRKLNAEGVGLPTDEWVLQHRMKREKVLREYYKEVQGEGAHDN
ncbi:hypothetical protein M0R04_09720 [Candidatus Dojkabacteria bacterium]|jgi:hypothetical protein|nr:hypothetical protein [Candidatus Dojkabacteria bacterium]